MPSVYSLSQVIVLAIFQLYIYVTVSTHMFCVWLYVVKFTNPFKEVS